MTNREAINWIINISADIGKAEHRDLWHYEQALSEIREMLEAARPEHSGGLYVDGFNDGYRERMSDESQWVPCSEPPKKDGTYIVYAPDYIGGSSSAKECHNGVMFSKYKSGKWSIEHGYYSRPNCVKAWRILPEPWEGEEHEW